MKHICLASEYRHVKSRASSANHWLTSMITVRAPWRETMKIEDPTRTSKLVDSHTVTMEREPGRLGDSSQAELGKEIRKAYNTNK